MRAPEGYSDGGGARDSTQHAEHTVTDSTLPFHRAQELTAQRIGGDHGCITG